MPDEWMMIRHNLPNDPAVVCMAADLSISQDEVVGILVRVWAWFRDHTTNGKTRAPKGFVDTIVARKTRKSFQASMADSGWLRVTKRGDEYEYALRNFNHWCSKSAKARALTRRRQQRKRDSEVRDERHAANERKRDAERDPEQSQNQSQSQRTTEPEFSGSGSEPECAAQENTGTAGADSGRAEMSERTAAGLARVISRADLTGRPLGKFGTLEFQMLMSEISIGDSKFRVAVTSAVFRHGYRRKLLEIIGQIEVRGDGIEKPGAWLRTALVKAGLTV